MGHAIALKAINETAKLIEGLWDACSVLEQDPSMRALNYPPHISLGIYEEIQESVLIETINSVATKFGKLEIIFDELQTFETEKAIVLWAKPNLLKKLKMLHSEIHTTIDTEMCEYHYRPENWIAHCTLATNIDISKKAEVDAFINGYSRSLVVIFDVIDCVSFFPIEVRRENELHGAL